MILPDVNVLVHAHNSDSAVHERARQWWDRCLAGTEGVGLAWIVILGFVRITTHPRVLLRPLPVAEVLDRVESWLRLPHVHVPQPSSRHLSGLRTHLEAERRAREAFRSANGPLPSAARASHRP